MPTVRHTSYFDDDDEDSFTHAAIKPSAGSARLNAFDEEGREIVGEAHPRHHRVDILSEPKTHPVPAALSDGPYSSFNAWPKNKLNKKYRELKSSLSAEYKLTYSILSKSSNSGWPAHQLLREVVEIKNELKQDQRNARKTFDAEHKAEIDANKARRGKAPVDRAAGHESIHKRRIRFVHKQYSTVVDLPALQSKIQAVVIRHSRDEGDLPLNPVPKDHGDERYFTSIALAWCFRAIRVMMRSTLQYILSRGPSERAESSDMTSYHEASTHAESIINAMHHIRKLLHVGRKTRRTPFVPALADADERVRHVPPP